MNLKELKSCLEQFEKETCFLKTNFCRSKERYNKLKEIDLLIHQRQVNLESFLKSNSEYFNTNLQVKTNLIRATNEQLLESIRNFHSTQFSTNDISNMSYNKTLNNTLLKNYEQLKSKMNFEPLQLCSHTNAQIDPACRVLLQDFLNLSNVKSQSFLFNSLLDRYFQVKKEANTINLAKKNYVRTNDFQSLSLDLRDALEKCAELDKENFKTYYQSLNERIDRCKKQSIELEQVRF
jgi:hypothetical protein